MLLEYVKSGIILYILLGLFAVSCLVFIFAKFRIRIIGKLRKKSGKEDRIKLHKRRKKYKTICKIIKVTIIPILFGIVVFAIQKYKYHIPDQYAWSLEDRKKEPNFEKRKRTVIEKRELYEKQLHFSWFSERNEETISQKSIERYKKNVTDIFSVYPDKEDVVMEFDESDSILAGMKQNFLSYVDKIQEAESSEELWKAYQDGVKTCEIWMTSEYIFQTGVLAESAAENDYKSHQKYEDSLYHTGGMLEQFEKFLDYRCRYAGKDTEKNEDIIITEKELAIRIAKRMYRLSKDNPNSDIMHSDMKRHSALFAYACMMYAVENIEPKDKWYLLSILYSSLCCLNLIQYIDDESLRTELCQKEVNQWNRFEYIEQILSKDMEEVKLDYKTEENISEKIMEAKERLENYTVSKDTSKESGEREMGE